MMETCYSKDGVWRLLPEDKDVRVVTVVIWIKDSGCFLYRVYKEFESVSTLTIWQNVSNEKEECSKGYLT